jgi:GH15 family glucan-1,4-alpha-glucosidase
MSLPIEQYGMIGDCHTAALVGSDGSIDWLCFPMFDSPACFAALLGEPKNGRWLLAPADRPKNVTRQYRGDSLILETEYETETGAVTVIDCMPPRTREPDLVRMVVGKRGTVRMRMELVIRFDYGWVVPWVRQTDDGIQAIAGHDTLVLRTPVKLRGEEFTTVSDFTVSAGERVPFVLVWHPSHHATPAIPDADDAIRSTEKWWQEWASQCNYEGPWRDAVMRSLVVLKGLSYAPTGAMVAAPTMSLPEKIGGSRNWDYRYCWLRDATFTVYALLNAGYQLEAKEFRDWLVRAVAGLPGELQIAYSILGIRRLTELELDWLPGYENSKPVRIGNAAWNQFQLDVYGEVLDMMHLSRRRGLQSSDAAWAVEKAILKFLEDAWQRPDDGIWEVRGPRIPITHSKVMAWVAFDRGVKAVESFGCEGPVEKWRQIRDRIHAEVCEHGFNSKLNSFVQYYGSDQLDGSLLMIPLVGFLEKDDPRLRGTVDAIQKRLMYKGFVYRHPAKAVEELAEKEGSFLACSFWMVDCLMLLGRHDEATELFERLLSVRNDVGLLAEEYDPVAGRQLGNFPQAFSHIGLVNSARNLTARHGPAKDRHQS